MSQPQTIEEIMQRIRAKVRDPEKAAANNKDTAPSKDTQVAEIMERLRQKTDAPQHPDVKGATDGRPPFTLKLHDVSRLRTEINTALEGTRQVGQINPRPPGLINRAIQLIKEAMRRSLTWYTRPLHHFQGGVVRALEQIAVILDNHNDSFRRVTAELARHADEIGQSSSKLELREAVFEKKTSTLDRQTASLEQRTASLEQKGTALENRLVEAVGALEAKLRDAVVAHEERIAAAMAAVTAVSSPLSQQIASISQDLEALRSELLKTRAELREANTRGRVRDRDVRRTLYGQQNGAAQRDEDQPASPPMFASGIKSDKEFDYFAFEDLYRGEEADIRSRQQDYLEYFRGRENVVDIGCGRGEFLELLRDNNISARGVELGLDQYLLCREKGLDVVQQDLFAYLESVPDESLGGLFSAQVIEHLTASDQLRYVALAYQKTKPGSPVIFETINVQCVYAVVRNFFLDPTHVRPVHPETLKFAMETIQFKNVELRFSGPVSDKQIPPLQLNGDTPQLAAFNRSMQELNDLIYGYQDYAAIGWH